MRRQILCEIEDRCIGGGKSCASYNIADYEVVNSV
mgnify:CR=1 FL=1